MVHLGYRRAPCDLLLQNMNQQEGLIRLSGNENSSSYGSSK